MKFKQNQVALATFVALACACSCVVASDDQGQPPKIHDSTKCSTLLITRDSSVLRTILSKTPPLLQGQMTDRLLDASSELRVVGGYKLPLPQEEIKNRLYQINPKDFSSRAAWRAALIKTRDALAMPHELARFIDSLRIEGLRGSILTATGTFILQGRPEVLIQVLLRDDIEYVAPDVQGGGFQPRS